jgi:hypothetical protein
VKTTNQEGRWVLNEDMTIAQPVAHGDVLSDYAELNSLIERYGWRWREETSNDTTTFHTIDVYGRTSPNLVGKGTHYEELELASNRHMIVWTTHNADGFPNKRTGMKARLDLPCLEKDVIVFLQRTK